MYSIGEIALVVIGILIALQINNWNLDKLERKEEGLLLQNIRVDFINAIDEFESRNTLREGFMYASNALQSIFRNDVYSFDRNYLDSLVRETLINPSTNTQTGTLQMLLNSGKINIISNKQLKAILIRWPNQLEDMREGEIYATRALQNFYEPLIREYLSSTIFEFVNIKGSFQTFNDGQISSSADYNGLLAERQFVNLLKQREALFRKSIIESDELIEISRDIIDLIDNEL